MIMTLEYVMFPDLSVQVKSQEPKEEKRRDSREKKRTSEEGRRNSVHHATINPLLSEVGNV